MRADFVMWQEFLGTFNCVSFWREDLHLEAELKVHTNKAGTTGFGAYFCGLWCMEDWPIAWVEVGYTSNLTFLEFFPILISVILWAMLWPTP